MKYGTTRRHLHVLYPRDLRVELHGRLTLSAVSDKEAFGPYDARYLSERHPEILLRDRFVADSPLEERRFELSVPP